MDDLLVLCKKHHHLTLKELKEEKLKRELNARAAQIAYQASERDPQIQKLRQLDFINPKIFKELGFDE